MKISTEDYRALLVNASKEFSDCRIFNNGITGKNRIPFVEMGVEAGNVEIYLSLYKELICRVLIDGKEIYNGWESDESFWDSDAVLKLAEAIVNLSSEERKMLFKLPESELFGKENKV